MGAVRLKLAYEPGTTKTRHHYKISIVKAYLGSDGIAPEVLAPDDPDAAAVAAPGSAGFAPPGQAPRNDAPRDGALSDDMVVRAGSATASGVPRAEVLLARALMLMLHPCEESGQSQYTFHERLAGGVAGQVVRVTDLRGNVFAAKCARRPAENIKLVAEAHLLGALMLPAWAGYRVVTLLGKVVANEDDAWRC